MSSRIAALVFIAALGHASLGCGSAVYQPSRTTTFEVDASAEIDDDDVRKAFDARPQMGERAQIAYYSFDPDKADVIEGMLKKLPGVTGTYRIPSLLATGQRRFEEHHPWDPPVPFSLKKLRLLAARARCDLLLVFDYGYKVESAPNGLVALSVLLLPSLFVPFVDIDVKSYMDTFVVDTRNGYLYAHVDAQREGGDKYLTIYAASGQRFIEEQWPGVLQDTSEAVRKVFETERAASASAPAASAASAASAAPSAAPLPLPAPPSAP